MGKRKKASKPPPKKSREALPTVFQCLFCNHENSVSVKMDKKAGIGHLLCKVCGQDFDYGINYLSAPVDVYSGWIDECDKTAKEAAEAEGPQGAETSSYRGTANAAPRRQREVASADEGDGDGEMDDFIEEDDEDAEAGYGIET